MTREEIAQRLIELGWLAGWPDAAAVPDIAFEVAKAAYATFHGIQVSEIEQHMALPRCALPDILPQVERITKWPINEIKYTFASYLPGLSEQQQLSGFAEAFGYWTAVANVRGVYTPSQGEANIVVTAGRIDGPSGTLAWSELPSGMRRLTQKYDSGEQRWIIMDPPQGGIDFVRVAAHELAHALGMGHINAGNLLAPVYSPRIRRPQAGDIAEMRERYGPPASQPTPIPTPTPIPGGGSMSPVFLALLKALLPLLMPILIRAIEDWLTKQQAVLDQWRQGQITTPQLMQQLAASAEAEVQALTQQP